MKMDRGEYFVSVIQHIFSDYEIVNIWPVKIHLQLLQDCLKIRHIENGILD